MPRRQTMDGCAIFGRDAALAVPGCADDNHLVPAGDKAAREFVDDRLQPAEVRWIVVRGDADAHAIRVR